MSAVIARRTDEHSRARPLLHEAVLVVGLLLFYRVGRLFGDKDPARGTRNAHRILDIERAVHLPSEQHLQAIVLRVPDLVRAANIYYAFVHFTITALVLLYLHQRRPGQYLRFRRALVAATAGGLVVELLVPASPPRMLAGFVDTGKLYGPSVYGNPAKDHLSNQFAAMPSLHVGWALLVAMAMIAAHTTRWRWLWLLHPVLTLFVVVVTGNHYWLDTIVGSALALAAFLGATLVGRHAAQDGGSSERLLAPAGGAVAPRPGRTRAPLAPARGR